MNDSLLAQGTNIGTIASAGSFAVAQDPNIVNIILTLVTVVGQIIVLFKKKKNGNPKTDL